jgi:BlaI family transcriptional regulator, penicillinase repressor
MNQKPTDNELEILKVLWANGQCTVREVNAELSKGKDGDIGYTTTLKLMQIMFEKGMVERDTTSRTHVYKALLNPDHTRQNILNRFIDTVFEGSATRLVMQALSKKASKDELEEIKRYINQLEKDGDQ